MENFLELNVVDPSTAPEMMELIAQTTWRNGFTHDLPPETCRYNMLAWCEEFVDMSECQFLWEDIHTLVTQMKALKEAMA